MASWLVDPTFKPIVTEAWNESNSWCQAVDSFQKKTMDWNINCYGNLFQRKRRIMARMDGINKRLAMTNNGYLSKLLQNLWNEYHSILEQENLFWRQKARCDWVKFGDRNTNFFHSSTVIGRKTKKIEALQNDSGEMITSHQELNKRQWSISKHCTTWRDLFLGSIPQTIFLCWRGGAWQNLKGWSLIWRLERQ